MSIHVLELLINFTFCGVLAFVLIKRIRPQLPKRGETPEQFMSRAYERLYLKRSAAKNLYGNFRKTLTVHCVNMALLIGICSLSKISLQAVNLGCAYLIIGLIVNWMLGTHQKSTLEKLRWNDRFWLRVFHAWFWPLYVWARFAHI